MELKWRPGGLSWEEFGRRLWAQLKRDDVVGRAAQLSFFFVPALFPFLLFLTSLLGYFAGAWKFLQWPFVLTFVLFAFTSIYYFAPNVKDARWRWLTPGSVLAVALWLLISFAFRAYLYFFDAYGRTYGSLGAVIVLLLWLFLTGAVILLGGEVNAVLENAAAEAGERDAKLHGQKEPGGGRKGA